MFILIVINKFLVPDELYENTLWNVFEEFLETSDKSDYQALQY
jgi:hypothetical protein